MKDRKVSYGGKKEGRDGRWSVGAVGEERIEGGVGENEKGM